MTRRTISILGESLRPKDAVFVTEYVKDFAPGRAAEAAGYSREHGHKLVERDEIRRAIGRVIDDRLKHSDIDAQFVLYELLDNHMIARQMGNINASNTALGLLMKHVAVDAMATNKIEMDVATDTEMIERLRRGRARSLVVNTDDDNIEDAEWSFV